MRTYYDVLGVRRDAGPEDIKRAYHQLALHNHPDKNPSAEAAEKMRQLNEAYQTLSDPAAKARYDARLMPSQPTRRTAGGYAGRASPPGADYGYEAPRHTIVYEHTAYFSAQNLLAVLILGASLGLVIAAVFILLGIRLDTRQGLAAAALLATFAMIGPPVSSIIQLRKTINSDSEASIIGSISLSTTLVIAVAAATIISTLFTAPGQGPNPFCACCGLAPAVAIVGWVIGGWMGKTLRQMLPI